MSINMSYNFNDYVDELFQENLELAREKIPDVYDEANDYAEVSPDSKFIWDVAVTYTLRDIEKCAKIRLLAKWWEEHHGHS